MSTIVTRAGKGSPLTNNEVDANFTNLNTDKYQAGDALGTPSSGTLTNCTGLPQSGVTNLTSDLALKAPLASPTFTGTPAAPTAAADTNTTQIATTAYVVGQGYLKSSTASSTYVALTGDQTVAGTKTFSSTITGSISGNAGTVTNGVYTTGDQTIGGTKTFSSTITGSISGNAGTVTNGVYTTGDQTIGGTKTFSSTITGSISGNAGTVTNGVYTTGSYANPAWITSLAETKVLPSQTGNNGLYLTTNGTSTSWAAVPSPNNGTLTLAVSGTGLSGSASFTANQSGNSTFTVTSNATSANTASTIVARDASGNFSAGTITATLSGNASTATSATSATTATTATNWGSYGAVPAAGTSFGTANTIGRSDANGYTYFNYINSNTANTENPTISQVIVTNGGDNFYRKASIAHLTSSLSGSAPINISGTSANTSSISSAVGGGYTWTGAQYFRSNGNTNAASGYSLQAYSDNASGAVMSFHRAGQYAVNMGLDSDNVFRIGGWSASANRLQMDMSGNLTMAGTVTANSDERLKEDIQVIDNALAKVESVRGVTYTWKSSGHRGIGVIAQEIQKVAPEAILVDNEGILSVAYGNLVGLLIEAVKELSAEVKELKQKVGE